jgi:hypothetical protein
VTSKRRYFSSDRCFGYTSIPLCTPTFCIIRFKSDKWKICRRHVRNTQCKCALTFCKNGEIVLFHEGKIKLFLSIIVVACGPFLQNTVHFMSRTRFGFHVFQSVLFSSARSNSLSLINSQSVQDIEFRPRFQQKKENIGEFIWKFYYHFPNRFPFKWDKPIF